ncbi:tRNA 5-methoxyuridine(34)/uridine 5-oxyacetic acid(34) synthase CmoB [Marinicella marina]|nr:tRNA 5-methoxyuridine(34)/uridine 5-oxyacetic acid(34) synthase CmoB [Marinicella marina]MDJ1141349.1 tRNA 5-methoxyuridine(34)/uridine 5-oxyacetic acid(34) synthase CmoB [Marinicella marina]
MSGSSLEPHKEALKLLTHSAIDHINQGDLARWLAAYDSLPELTDVQWLKHQQAISVKSTSQVSAQLTEALKALQPWRKGPFLLDDVYVDAEWRSDYKWQRLQEHLPELQNRTILDVGCGNGYYMFRMAEEQPRLLLGVEPGLLQNVQFWAIEKYVQSGAVVLPLRVQELPVNMCCFDVVFSMGILYHRKSPMAHLEQLKNLLSSGGTLVLETLVVDGDENTCLVPVGRYAQMRNVWFLPSPDMLCIWLQKIGFKNMQVVDVSVTTTAEQRGTEWMQFHSLPQFLSADEQLTTEGHPPPKRVIITCQK